MDPPVPARLRAGPTAAACVLLGALLCASGCAAWHDFFQRDQADAPALWQALARPAPSRTDVAIALGCPSEADGSPSDCLRCRVAAAVRQVQRARVRAVIFSGGAAHNRHVEADVMARLARDWGLAPQQILVEGRSLTTWQNLRFTQRIMRAHGYHTALIISTRNHLPRARRFAEYYGLDAALAACEDAPVPEGAR